MWLAGWLALGLLAGWLAELGLLAGWLAEKLPSGEQ